MAHEQHTRSTAPAERRAPSRTRPPMTIARYHAGQRRLQDAFDSRRIADRLDEVTYSAGLGEAQSAMIERADMFFLATAAPDGQPDCSFKGGRPGFVRVLSPVEIAWPDYDG